MKYLMVCSLLAMLSVLPAAARQEEKIERGVAAPAAEKKAEPAPAPPAAAGKADKTYPPVSLAVAAISAIIVIGAICVPIRNAEEDE